MRKLHLGKSAEKHHLCEESGDKVLGKSKSRTETLRWEQTWCFCGQKGASATKPGDGEKNGPREGQKDEQELDGINPGGQGKEFKSDSISVENHRRPVNKGVTQFNLGFEEIILADV